MNNEHGISLEETILLSWTIKFVFHPENILLAEDQVEEPVTRFYEVSGTSTRTFQLLVLRWKSTLGGRTEREQISLNLLFCSLLFYLSLALPLHLSSSLHYMLSLFFYTDRVKRTVKKRCALNRTSVNAGYDYLTCVNVVHPAPALCIFSFSSTVRRLPFSLHRCAKCWPTVLSGKTRTRKLIKRTRSCLTRARVETRFSRIKRQSRWKWRGKENFQVD